ncbi:MAG TPA: hypothetical protein VNF51_01545 [Candidatus Paceibacterota bacterium]|nr:hypothetical protein [Candidatus Paceibacterota bacterium]
MRTFTDITPPSRRRETEPPVRPNGGASERSRFPYAMFAAIVLIIGGSIGALFYFSSVSVDITPNTVSAAVQGSFTANQNSGSLPYEIITAQKIATQSVNSSGTKTVNSSASGTITIYNTQAKSQRLITNTRFATASGLVFRIHSGITIPGGSVAKPGNITATVYADQIGNSYNIGPTSFTIPGFAGTPLASEVYARSSVSMIGGSSGNVPVVDPAVESQTQNALISALAPDLLTSIRAQVPSGYILLDGAATTTFQELAPTPSETTGQVDIKEQGTITAVVFPNSALAGAIAASINGIGSQNEPFTLASSSTLLLSDFSLPDPSATSFSFVLTGTASLVYTVDPTRIAAAVAGKTRSEAEVALTNYPEVKRAIIVLRPFWRQTFPQDPASISIVINNP